jgi:hypothetical protein
MNTRSTSNNQETPTQGSVFLQMEPEVPPPKIFDGSRTEDKAKTFAEETQAVFELQPRRFSSFEIKMTYISRFLTGSALVWFKSTRGEHVDISSFWNSFLTRFSLNIPKEEKEAKLLTIKLGPQERINQFNCRFRVLSDGMGFNDIALKCIYKHALSAELRNSLYNFVPAPTNLDSMMESCEVIEARKLQGKIYGDQELPRHNNNEFTNRRSNNGGRGNDQTSQERNLPRSRPNQNPSTEATTTSNRVDEEERARRLRLGLCFYCGLQGHRSFDCPSKNGALRH